ncbi:hypothetical protein [Wenyingzhuangia aestuarii]|uniref:hypothetical protein n=1 Tax=Wenyingzhuangia aestuarii TaxID=1647582 RepID=UPI00143967D8|nr:hypothetical protein [Wenyingzhuangia aestuarii]NJB82588.1 hypothetical protein [Wenyingzhuangia aestuarii]
MKKLFLFFASCFLITATASATTTYSNDTPFVFIENGVEYAIFKNGEFDFNIINPRTSRVNINTSFVNVSFNSGRNYAPYIQRNRYGDIVRIDNTSIYYDYNGRVNRVGSVAIRYNRSGYVQAIGNLNIQYTNYGRNYVCTGSVNRINYHYKPISRHYKKPTRHHHAYVVKKTPVRHYSYNRNTTKKSPERYYSSNSSKRKDKIDNSSKKREFTKQKTKKETTKKESSSSSYRKNSNSYRR